MRLDGSVALVTGAASGLGAASARRLVDAGARVVLADRAADRGAEMVAELGDQATFATCDVTDSAQIAAAVDATAALGPLRILVHCAGGGWPVRVLTEGAQPQPLQDFAAIVQLNLIGTFDVLRQASARMASNDPLDGERGVAVLTSSIAAFEGQSAQLAYAAAKAGIVGMTIAAARDLSRHGVRVCTIAPGMFATAMMNGLTESTRDRMSAAVPHPSRLGRAEEFATLAAQIVENGYLNGETIRLDGAFRMGGVDTSWGEQLDRD